MKSIQLKLSQSGTSISQSILSNPDNLAIAWTNIAEGIFEGSSADFTADTVIETSDIGNPNYTLTAFYNPETNTVRIYTFINKWSEEDQEFTQLPTNTVAFQNWFTKITIF